MPPPGRRGCRASTDTPPTRAVASVALDRLDPERASRELKSALRARPAPDVPDTDHILSLRRRHESIHSVKNRRQDLTVLIERAFADAETLAATVTTAAAVGSDREVAAMNELIDRMAADARALEAAHAEVAEIGVQLP